MNKKALDIINKAPSLPDHAEVDTMRPEAFYRVRLRLLKKLYAKRHSK